MEVEYLIAAILGIITSCVVCAIITIAVTTGRKARDFWPEQSYTNTISRGHGQLEDNENKNNLDT